MASSAQPAVSHRPGVAAATAVACGVALVGVGVLAFAAGFGHDRDAAMLQGFSGFYGPSANAEIEAAARVTDPLPYALGASACLAVALARRRTATAVTVGVVLLGTAATAEALKHLLAQPRHADWLGGGQIDPASWPSGHASAAMALALCAVIVAPRAWRAGVALLGTAGTVGLAYATLALAWHYPSDVLGGFLLAGLWVSLALAALQRFGPGELEPAPPTGVRLLVAIGAAGVLAAGVVAHAASERAALAAPDRATTIAGAVAIAGLALTLAVVTLISASGTGGRGALRAARGA